MIIFYYLTGDQNHGQYDMHLDYRPISHIEKLLDRIIFLILQNVIGISALNSLISFLCGLFSSKFGSYMLWDCTLSLVIIVFYPWLNSLSIPAPPVLQLKGALGSRVGLNVSHSDIRFSLIHKEDYACEIP